MKNIRQPYSPCIMKSQLIAIVAAVLVLGCGSNADYAGKYFIDVMGVELILN